MTNAEFKKGLEERTLAFSVRLFDYLNTLPNKKSLLVDHRSVGTVGVFDRGELSRSQPR